LSKIKIRRYKQDNDKSEVVPKRKNKVLAIILRENKSTLWKWISYKANQFRVGKHTYFKEPSGMYLSKNKVLCSFYVEGVSVPINHTLLERKKEVKEIIDPNTGEKKFVSVDTISNLKFDSEVVDILLNRGLADEFTKVHLDARGLATIVLLILVVLLGLANLGVTLS